MNALPQLAEDCDLRSLPIGPSEAFLLSRVDGMSNIEDLSNATGIPQQTVSHLLKRLAHLGAIHFGESSPPESEAEVPLHRGRPADTAVPHASVSTAVSSTTTQSATVEAQDDAEATVDHGTPVQSGAMEKDSFTQDSTEEQVDLSEGFKEKVLRLYDRLDIMSHYDLLGVPRDADKKEIKNAYFAQVNEFHTDRFFGRSLGSYKMKIDKIFTALTRANDTLSRKKTRAEYDRYLESREETLGFYSEPPRTRADFSENVAAEPVAQEQIVRNDGSGGQAAPFSTSDANRPKIDQGSFKSEATPSQRSPMSSQARRRLAAKKLKGSLSGEHKIPQVRKASREEIDQAVRADLKARLAAKDSSPALCSKYVALAREAEQAREWASAANALRTALELKPDDPELQADLERVLVEVDRTYAGKFLEQAKYEEQDGQLERAARSFARAARGKDSAELYARSAECLLRLLHNNTSVEANIGRKAVKMARQAVSLEPENVRAYLTLAKAYFSEKMPSSAQAEVNRALEIDPKNEAARRLQKDFKKAT